MHQTKLFSSLIITLLIMLIGNPANALVQATDLPLTTAVEAFIVDGADNENTKDSAPLVLTITLNMDKDWYTYGHIPSDMGKPTKLTATTHDGKQLRVVYPIGKLKPDTFDPSVIVHAYENGTILYVPIPSGAQLPITMKLELLLCHPTKCIPARIDLNYGKDAATIASLPFANNQEWWPSFMELAKKQVQSSEGPSESEMAEAIINWQFTPEYLQPGLEVGGLLSAILMGLLAGLILNIMPCVLPVVSLKLSALLNPGGTDDPEDRQTAFREHNVFFSFGVITFFFILAIVLGATGQAWGALFQNRWLVLGVAGLIMALGLSLFGLFHLPVIDLKFGTGHQNPKAQAFFTGMLTTLLATPCSGPFLGGVLGWALIQGPLIIGIVFISIGIGMAIPYILMAFNPSWSRFLPKSGPWIQYVEKGIGFFLIGTGFYLVSIAIGGESLRILAPLWAIIFGSWLWIKSRTSKSNQTRWTIRVATLVILAFSVVLTAPKSHVDPWESFDPVQLSQRIGKEQLFVEFTADWCPTCKVLEATVLTPENVSYWKDKYGIAFIKVDMTERDPEAEALLAALGSRSIPTAALFSIGEDSNSPLVLRDLYTKSQLENILESWKK